MSWFICSYCKKSLRNKQKLDVHELNCGEKINNYMSDKYRITCTFPDCKSEFTSLGNLNKHIKKYHTSFDQNISINSTNNVTKNITNNITNNITKNINIGSIKAVSNNDIKIQPLLFVKHGEEKIDHITKEFLLKLLNYASSQKMFFDLMEQFYFSREVPENNNWMLAYPYNDKAAVVYDHDKEKFTRASTEKTINDKFSNMIDKLVGMIDEIREGEELTRNQQLNVLHFLDKECVYDLSEQYPEIFGLMHKLGYDKREIPMASWKEQGLDAKHLSIKF